MQVLQNNYFCIENSPAHLKSLKVAPTHARTRARKCNRAHMET